MAALSSFGSIIPEPSVSNKLNASLISSISSSVKPGLSKAFLLTGDFYPPNAPLGFLFDILFICKFKI